MTGQMGYEKLYFENSTYKYCQRTHASINNTKKSLTKNIFSKGVVRFVLHGKWNPAALQKTES